MISNLLENAVKYSDMSDKIYIETNFDYVSREIHVYIRNNGRIPILEEDTDRIFEYAYRSKMARDKDPSSTGVGLYYSRYIANRHGATLTLEKRHNPVTFKLVMPLKLLCSAEKAEATLSKIV
jgi:two-component system heavy metal sensor histidine kinase CusS